MARLAFAAESGPRFGMPQIWTNQRDRRSRDGQGRGEEPRAERRKEKHKPSDAGAEATE